MRAQVFSEIFRKDLEFSNASTTIQHYSIQYTTVQCNSESLQLRANTQIGTEIRFQEYLFTDHSLIINCLKTITIVGKLSKALSE